MQMHKERYLWLLSRKLSGEILDDERKELDSLTATDPRLRKETDTLHAYWRKNDSDQDEEHTSNAFEKLKDQMRAADPQLWPAESDAPRNIKWWALMARMAAAIVVLVGAYYVLLATGLIPGEEDGLRAEYNIRGTRSHIKLADGTTVWLNSDSELKYPLRFKGNKREVYLKGEAFFDVAKNAEKPFIVHTETMTVNVLGTSFNVKAYPNDSVSETTLITGEVEVEIQKTDKKIRLRPAEKLVINSSTDSLQSPVIATQPLIIRPTYFSKNDSAIVETAWVDNKFVFHDESFSSLASRMERWYNVSIRFENTTITQLRFTGIFNKESLEQALDALQLTEQFKYKITDDNTVIIY